MRLSRPFAVALLAAATIACAAIAAAAAPFASYDHPPVSGPWSLAPGEYYVDLSGSSFQTSSGYDADGNIVSLGGTSEQRAFRSYMELGWKKSWSVQLTVPFVSQTVRPFGGAAATQTGLEDFRIGLRRSIHNGGTGAAVQFAWEAPAGYNRHLTPAIGDGLQKLSATLQLGGRLGHASFWQLGGGARFQYHTLADIGDDFSSKATSTTKAESWKFPEHLVANGAVATWIGRLQVAGEFASDASSFGPDQRAAKVTSLAVGTRFTYRTDGKLDAFAGSWHTPSGKNAVALNQYYAGIAWKSTKLDRLQGFIGGDKRP